MDMLLMRYTAQVKYREGDEWSIAMDKKGLIVESTFNKVFQRLLMLTKSGDVDYYNFWITKGEDDGDYLH
jgi:hypothetical protein